MSFFSAIFLGFIQGVAEFLPISSSGHLKFFQSFFGMSTSAAEDNFFDVLLHLGTLAAVFIAYWPEIKGMILEFFTMIHLRKLPKGQKPDRLSRRMILLIIIGTLPLFVILPIKDMIDSLSGSTIFIGCAFLITGTLLFLSDRFRRGSKDAKTATLVDVLLVGLGQAFATLPGISRSGTTVTIGMSRGFDREFAVKYSFLMSIPAVLGAGLLSLIDAVQMGINWSLMPMYAAGMLTSLVIGYLSIRLLKFITQRSHFGIFSFYCWGIGIVTLILSLIK